MFDTPDRTYTINHALGKIKLHTRAQRSATIQVKLQPPKGALMVISTRRYGESWRVIDPERTNPGFYRIIHHYLNSKQNFDTLYLSEEELKDVPKRFLEKYPVN